MAVEIKIDVTDWAEEYQQEEVDLSTPDRLVEAQQERGYSPKQGGRMLVIAKHRGETFEDVVEPKEMVQLGSARWFIRYFTELKEVITLDSGKEIEIRSLSAPISTEDGDIDDPAYVEWSDPTALDNAENYLLGAVPGHIKGRLKFFVAQNAEKRMRGVVKELHAKIDEMVEGLV